MSESKSTIVTRVCPKCGDSKEMKVFGKDKAERAKTRYCRKCTKDFYFRSITARGKQA